MRILFDQGIFDMRNAGNTALLQVAVKRLKKRWPDASVEITTLAPRLLKIYFPEAQPVSPDGSHAWFKNRDRFKKTQQLIPTFVWRLLLEIREEIWYRWPTLASPLTRSKIRLWFRRGGDHHPPESAPAKSEVEQDGNEIDYSEVVSGTDLFVATGSQYMSDVARNAGLGVLDRLEAAIRLGIPTAMVGQGMGPIENPVLRARAKKVLPLVDLIFVRERLEAPKLLNSLGVDPDRVFVTGDDAIELAYEARTPDWGNGIGVSLRVMPYTEIDNKEFEIVGAVLKQAASKYGAQLIALPISRSIHERDDRVIGQLQAGYEKIWISRSKFQTPLEIIKNTQRCRLVVTGTFHAAVFALAQGIPTVCLAKSASYINKLSGLADLFGPGCEVILLNTEHLQEKLSTAIDTGWQSAQQMRPQLLTAAARQIESGHAAYQRLYELFESKNCVKQTLVKE